MIAKTKSPTKDKIDKNIIALIILQLHLSQEIFVSLTKIGRGSLK